MVLDYSSSSDDCTNAADNAGGQLLVEFLRHGIRMPWQVPFFEDSLHQFLDNILLLSPDLERLTTNRGPRPRLPPRQCSEAGPGGIHSNL